MGFEDLYDDNKKEAKEEKARVVSRPSGNTKNTHPAPKSNHPNPKQGWSTGGSKPWSTHGNSSGGVNRSIPNPAPKTPQPDLNEKEDEAIEVDSFEVDEGFEDMDDCDGCETDDCENCGIDEPEEKAEPPKQRNSGGGQFDDLF